MSSVRRCRLCSAVEGSNPFINIFGEEQGTELVQKIQRQLPFLLISSGDIIQNLICHDCFRVVDLYDCFYETTRKAEVLRSQNLSAPERNRRNLDLVPTKGKSLRPCPKKRFDRFVGDPESNSESTSDSETTEVQENTMAVERPITRESAFIVNKISTETVVFTCPDCCQVFSRITDTAMHNCVRLEDCREVETVWDKEQEVGRKTVPPLKISLFSVKSGLFGCYMCQNAFEKKSDAIQHIKTHFNQEEAETATEKKRNKGERKSKGQKKKRMRREQADVYVDWRKKKKKKKKDLKSPRERPRSDMTEELPESSTRKKRGRPRSDTTEELPQPEIQIKRGKLEIDKAEEPPQPPPAAAPSPAPLPEKCEIFEEGNPKTEPVKPEEEIPPPVQNFDENSQYDLSISEADTLSINHYVAGGGQWSSEGDSLSAAEDVPDTQEPSGSGLQFSRTKVDPQEPSGSGVQFHRIKVDPQEPSGSGVQFCRTKVDPQEPSGSGVQFCRTKVDPQEPSGSGVQFYRTKVPSGSGVQFYRSKVDSQEASGSGVHSHRPKEEPLPEEEDVTIVAVVPKRTAMTFMSCVFCDKIFSSREALVYHQNRHVNSYPGLITGVTEKKTLDVRPEGEEESHICRVCQMTFFSKRTLIQHESFHQVDCKVQPSTETSPNPQEKEQDNPDGKDVITIL